MKYILVVSPDYLDAIFDETKKFSFAINGYGNAANASKGLLYANANDILGYILCYEDFARLRQSELRNLTELIRKIDLIGGNKEVVVATRGQLGFLSKPLSSCKNVNVVKDTNIEYLSDTEICKKMIGPILLDNYVPYKLKDTKDVKSKKEVNPDLLYAPIISDTILDVISKVYVLESLEDTLDNDLVYSKFSDTDPVFAIFRKLKVMQVLNLDTTLEEQRFSQSLASLPVETRVLYQEVYNLMKGGKI